MQAGFFILWIFFLLRDQLKAAIGVCFCSYFVVGLMFIYFLLNEICILVKYFLSKPIQFFK